MEKQSGEFGNHRLGNRSDGICGNCLKEMCVLITIYLHHALFRKEQGGKTYIGKAVAEFKDGSEGCGTDTLIIVFPCSLSSCAPFIIRKGIDHLSSCCHLDGAPLLIERLQQLLEVIIGDACVFKRVVEIDSSIEGLDVIIIHRDVI